MSTQRARRCPTRKAPFRSKAIRNRHLESHVAVRLPFLSRVMCRRSGLCRNLATHLDGQASSRSSRPSPPAGGAGHRRPSPAGSSRAAARAVAFRTDQGAFAPGEALRRPQQRRFFFLPLPLLCWLKSGRTQTFVRQAKLLCREHSSSALRGPRDDLFGRWGAFQELSLIHI